MAKKATRKLPDFGRGECFEIATRFSNLSDGILGGTRAQYKDEVKEAERNVGSALRAAAELRRLGHFKREIASATKELKKAERILKKKTLNRKDRMDVFYGLSRLHIQVFKGIYSPARRRCGLKKS